MIIVKQKYKYEIDVFNETRMHIWRKETFRIDTKLYKSFEDTIDK